MEGKPSELAMELVTPVVERSIMEESRPMPESWLARSPIVTSCQATKSTGFLAPLDVWAEADASSGI